MTILNTFRKLTVLLMLTGSLMMGMMVLAVQAQDSADAPVASGLNSPRHLRFADDGTLYIAEAGFGGDLTATAQTGNGEVKMGNSGRISTVASDGVQGFLIDGLPSSVDSFSYSEGVSDMLVTGDTLWLLAGQGPAVENMPPDFLSPMAALVKFTVPGLEQTQSVDFFAFELANNPDGAGDTASNPQEIAVADDGTVYIIDASANALLSWTESDGLKLVTAWDVDETGATPSPVPSSLAIAPDGSLYVGFLSGFPFPPGGAKIEHWVDGALAETFEGLSLVTDVAVGQDGSLYAVQFADGFGQTGFNPGSGSIVEVSADGITSVMSGLNFPYAIAQNADGEWFVTVNSAFSEPGSGAVLRVVESEGGDGGNGSVESPVATPVVTPEA